MPRYQVKLEGSDINISGEVAGDASKHIAGFFTVRIVEAEDAARASAEVLRAVAAEWASGSYARFNAAPKLAVSQAKQLGFIGGMFARESGYVFYPSDEAI